MQFSVLMYFTEAVVRYVNRGSTNVSVHVHGQYNRAPFDGWASDYAYPGQYKDYHYPNGQNARTIWYHVSKDVEVQKWFARIVLSIFRIIPSLRLARTYIWVKRVSTSCQTNKKKL